MAYRVFFADSSPSALNTLHMAFQDSTYDLYTTSDGGEVLGLVHQIKPDAIALGLSLPQKDGYEIARMIRDVPDFKQTPIILLCGAGEDVEEKRLSGLDYAEIVVKPFDSEELAHRIRSLISGTQDPESLPEEPEPVSDQGASAGTALPPEPAEPEAGEALVARVRQEILEMERELEKRIAARVKAELKAWLQFDQAKDSENP